LIDLGVLTPPDQVVPGATVDLLAVVENAGDALGEYAGALRVDGRVEPSPSAAIEPGERAEIPFSVTASRVGELELRLDDRRISLHVLGPAQLVVDGLRVPDGLIERDETFTATVSVVNEGGLPGSRTLAITLNGTAVGTDEVTLLGGERSQLSFPLLIADAGPHEIAAGELTAEVRVVDIRRPPSGKVVLNKVDGGPGQLVIENQRDDDAFFVLTRANEGSRPLLAVYVHEGDSSRITGIRNGSYNVYYGTGERWDRYSGRFTGNAAFRRDPEPLRFTSSGGRYSVWTFTLYTAVGGPGSDGQPVDADEFPDLEGEGDAD